jgi:hypothetical protein
MEKYKSFQTAGVQKLTFNRTQFSLGFNEVRMPIVTVKVSLFKLKKILNRVVETILKDKVYNLKDLKPTIANGIVTVTVPFEKELAAGRYKIEASVELKTDASVLNSKILKAPVINSSKIISL